MRKLLFFFLLVCAANLPATAGIYVYQPQDKFTTFDEVFMLTGVSRDIEIFKINDRLMPDAADGPFSFGLVLSPGKNLVELRALAKNKEHIVRKLRVLRLKNFPDLEELYDGKPHWARTQIIYLSTLGIIEGYPDDVFYPGRPITRAELATWVARAKNLPTHPLRNDVFFDVPKEHWRAPYIKVVTDTGIMRPYDKELFGPDDPISRRQAAEVAVLAEGYDVVERIKPLFVDVPREEKGAFPIYVAKEKGLVLGVSKDIAVFDPDRALTRAEAAVLISRFQPSVDRIRDLFDFEKGFSPKNYCRINAYPKIISFAAEPPRLRRGARKNLLLRLRIGNRENYYPISKVKVDLGEIGGALDAEMFEELGGEGEGDLVYALNISLSPPSTGSKRIIANVVDRLGWESEESTRIIVFE